MEVFKGRAKEIKQSVPSATKDIKSKQLEEFHKSKQLEEFHSVAYAPKGQFSWISKVKVE